LDVLDVRKQREHITLYHHRKYEGVRSVFEPCKEARGKGRLAKGYMYFYHALCRKRKHESKDNTNGKITLQIKIPKEEQNKRKPSIFYFVTPTESNSYKTACKRACFTM